MPGGLSGRELGERLLAEDPHLPVIYTSGYSPGMAGSDLSLFKDRNFLAKPYAPAKLLQIVRNCWIARRREFSPSSARRLKGQSQGVPHTF